MPHTVVAATLTLLFLLLSLRWGKISKLYQARPTLHVTTYNSFIFHSFKQIKDKDVTLLDLSGSPVTLDTLSLLEHAAQNDADGEEEDGCRDARRRVVVLNTSSAVGAVGPF